MPSVIVGAAEDLSGAPNFSGLVCFHSRTPTFGNAALCTGSARSSRKTYASSETERVIWFTAAPGRDRYRSTQTGMPRRRSLKPGSMRMKSKTSVAYSYYDVETCRNSGEPSANSIRVRPVDGQGLPSTMNAECSTSMRKQYPVGTVFRIRAQVVENSTGATFLYTHFSWPFEVISRPDRPSHRPLGGALPVTSVEV